MVKAMLLHCKSIAFATYCVSVHYNTTFLPCLFRLLQQNRKAASRLRKAAILSLGSEGVIP